jgi:hypothetical protein
MVFELQRAPVAHYVACDVFAPADSAQARNRVKTGMAVASPRRRKRLSTAHGYGRKRGPSRCSSPRRSNACAALDSDSQRVGDRQGAFLQAFGQRFALEVLEHQEVDLVGLVRRRER